jgi:hypothetical protein
MQIRKIAKGAKKTYIRGAKLAGKTVNKVMKPGTKIVRRVTKKVPVLGRTLTTLAGVPRRVTKGGTSMIIALPRAAGRIAGTGVRVAKHAMFDPLLALGGRAPLVALGLLPSGKPKKVTHKTKLKPRRKK